MTEPTIDKCWQRNSDGAGFALVKDGKVVIHKGYLKLDDFKKAYLESSTASNVLVHFRIGTSGKIDKDNTHPFSIKGGAMVHNGVLFHPEGDKSDTRVMVDKWYNKLNKANLLECSDQLAKTIGTYNKLAFLFDDDSYHIVNEHMGEWDKAGKVWFSNTNWR